MSRASERSTKRLEKDLAELGTHLAYPPTPPIADCLPTTRATDLHARSSRRLSIRAVAVSVLIIALFASVVVPGARATLLDFFGISGVEIDRSGEALVASTAEADAGLRVSDFGTHMTAPYPVSFAPLDVPEECPWDGGDCEIEAAGMLRVLAEGEGIRGGMVTAIYQRPDGSLIALSQFDGASVPVIRKVLGQGATVEDFELGGSLAVWIEGSPHQVSYLDSDQTPIETRTVLGGNVLLWQTEALSVRVEGEITRAQAVELVGALR